MIPKFHYYIIIDQIYYETNKNNSFFLYNMDKISYMSILQAYEI